MIWASSQLCGKILGRWIIHEEVGTPKAIHNIQETLWSEKTGLWTLHLTDRRNSSLQYKHSSSRKKPNLLHCNPIFWSEHRTLNCAPDTSEFMLSKCCPCFCRYWSSIDCFPQFYSCKLWRNITVLHHKTFMQTFVLIIYIWNAHWPSTDCQFLSVLFVLSWVHKQT